MCEVFVRNIKEIWDKIMETRHKWDTAFSQIREENLRVNI